MSLYIKRIMCTKSDHAEKMTIMTAIMKTKVAYNRLAREFRLYMDFDIL